MTSASGGQRSIQLSYGRNGNARNKPSSVRRRSGRRVIYLGPSLLTASSGLPGTQVERATPHPLFGLAPGRVYRATSVSGGPVRSYRTLSPLPVPPRGAIGGLLSVALSVVGRNRRPGVTRHPALRSSDFPPSAPRRTRRRPPLRTSFVLLVYLYGWWRTTVLGAGGRVGGVASLMPAA